jgi:hypothetical protein
VQSVHAVCRICTPGHLRYFLFGEKSGKIVGIVVATQLVAFCFSRMSFRRASSPTIENIELRKTIYNISSHFNHVGGRNGNDWFIVQKNITILSIGMFAFAAFFVTGCKKNDSNPVGNSTTVTTSADVADAADAVSDALASNNGGAMDQVNDVFEIAGGVGVGGGALGKVSSDTTIVASQYDTTTMSWTTTTYKVQSTPPSYYGIWTRAHWLQFWANGKAQKFRVTNGVVADTILHRLDSLGNSGYFYTPRLVHHLLSITSNWVCSNTNTDTVTINGSYNWSGIDTILAPASRKGRVLVHTIALTFVNVKGPRGTRYAHSEKTSGTITCTYTATVTPPGNASYVVTKTFTIVLGGGDATFSIDGTKYISDLGTGDHN